MGATSPLPLPSPIFSPPPPPPPPTTLQFCVVCVLCAKKSVHLYSTQDVVKTRKCVTRMRTHDHRLGGRAGVRKRERVVVVVVVVVCCSRSYVGYVTEKKKQQQHQVISYVA